MSDATEPVPSPAPEPKKKAAKTYKLINTGAGPRPVMIGFDTYEFGPYEAKEVPQSVADHPDARGLVDQGYLTLQEV